MGWDYKNTYLVAVFVPAWALELEDEEWKKADNDNSDC